LLDGHRRYAHTTAPRVDTANSGTNPIYLFDGQTGKMVGRMIEDLSQVCERLVFSADGH
jgi:hypothetical protein